MLVFECACSDCEDSSGIQQYLQWEQLPTAIKTQVFQFYIYQLDKIIMPRKDYLSELLSGYFTNLERYVAGSPEHAALMTTIFPATTVASEHCSNENIYQSIVSIF